MIQIDNYVYGFNFAGKRIHIFPHRKTKNGVFQKQSLTEWTKNIENKKATKIFIPVNKEEKEALISFYTDNIKTPIITRLSKISIENFYSILKQGAMIQSKA